jgi:hypothetical protein
MRGKIRIRGRVAGGWPPERRRSVSGIPQGEARGDAVISALPRPVAKPAEADAQRSIPPE